MGSSLKPSTRRVLASTLLVAFASRALIPPGFMPAPGRPFSIEICWEGLPAGVLAPPEHAHADSMAAADSMIGADSMAAADSMPGMEAASAASAGKSADSLPQGSAPAHSHPAHQMPGTPSHTEHCVFGTACSAGPIPHLPLPTGLWSAQQLPTLAFASRAAEVRLVHLPQPRAPPGRLS